MKNLPQHLQKYVVEQDYSRYTPVDQACWRYILHQLRAFLSVHGHPAYSEGLLKAGISVDEIPHIETISKSLEPYGWRALPVSGFIPPAAFMEMQALGVLPIASDMRTLEHLDYTPAPDIVHEAAGHAPILIDPEFSNYLRAYAQVAKKAILSSEDLELYEAIRNLSDLKENPDSTAEQIEMSQKHLEKVSKEMSHVSEAVELSRMNWWTAEYGLVGDLKNPKIYGAGLLSSVGESRWCLSEKVKKIPLSSDCIRTTYDITEPQPQLFVTPDFKSLHTVLEDMARGMAFRQGGIKSLEKAILAKTVNSVQFNSGIQISGQLIEVIHSAYLRFQGPTQLCLEDQEILGQGPAHHPQGFGTAFGFLADIPGRCPSYLSDNELEKLGLSEGKASLLRYASGVEVRGTLKKKLRHKGRLVLLTFTDCEVKFRGQVLFEPAWGVYDLAIGSEITSVFGGPADRIHFTATEDFKALRVPRRQWNAEEQRRHERYQRLRDWRSGNLAWPQSEAHLSKLLGDVQSVDWLWVLEVYETMSERHPAHALRAEAFHLLEKWGQTDPKLKNFIADGLALLPTMKRH